MLKKKSTFRRGLSKKLTLLILFNPRWQSANKDDTNAPTGEDYFHVTVGKEVERWSSAKDCVFQVWTSCRTLKFANGKPRKLKFL